MRYSDGTGTGPIDTTAGTDTYTIILDETPKGEAMSTRTKPRDVRNLPDVVRRRLDDTGDALDRITARVRAGMFAEARSTPSTFELRMSADDAPIIDGYATVYETWYDVLGGPENGYGWREMFATGSTSKSVAERDDVRLLVNHDGLALARTRSGTLTLESDTIGLRSEAELDPRSPIVQGLTSAMERGDVDEMSLAFRVIRQEWNDDYTERIVREVELFDVSMVTYPANPATVAQLRATDESDATDPTDPAGHVMSVDTVRALSEALRRR